jgi:outer membrane protein assembly factor BamB
MSAQEGARRGLAVLAVALATACPGPDAGRLDGGHDSGVAPALGVSLSPAELAVSASLFDTNAPVASFTLRLSEPYPLDTLPVFFSYGGSVVTRVSLGAMTREGGTANVELMSPARLGVGTFQDQITIRVCNDGYCQSPLSGSPLTATVSYTVSRPPPPTLSSISPVGVAQHFLGLTLTLKGSGFTSDAVVLVDGALRSTQFVSHKQLIAQLLAIDTGQVGTKLVRVRNGPVGRDLSDALTFTAYVSGQPRLERLTPCCALAGTPGLTLALHGQGFLPISQVVWNGPGLATTYLSDTALLAEIPASSLATPGQFTVGAVNEPNRAYTGALFYVVAAEAPSIQNLSPARALAGDPPLQLAVLGANFTPDCVVRWRGGDRPTSIIDPTRLETQLGPGDLLAAGSADVSVWCASRPDGASGSVAFRIDPLGPVQLFALQPPAVPAGTSDFTLTIRGARFGTGTLVSLNGTPRATTLASATELRAVIPASDVASAGPAAVSVLRPDGSRAAATLTVGPRVTGAVAFQIDPGHSGAATFSSVNFPSSPRWTADLGASPSYALLAEGMVFVTAGDGVDGGLYALDQATGAIRWGPVPLAGVANAAYEDGQVFVVSGGAVMQAFSAATGTLNWTSTFTGAAGSAPVALGGKVFSGSTWGSLYALDAVDGHLVWALDAMAGAGSPPAVTVDGVYQASPCANAAARPSSGTVVWSSRAYCPGYTFSVPVVANGAFYANDGAGTPTGHVLGTSDGALLGDFASDVPPAISSGVGYFLRDGTLRGTDLADGGTLWAFVGDGTLVTSPIAINRYVVVGSASGAIYALEGRSGQLIWSYQLGRRIAVGANLNPWMPLSGLSAGDGLLVVPAGTALTAFTLSPTP